MAKWKFLSLIKTFGYWPEGRFVRHRATGEVMMLLDSGNSDGFGDHGNVERFNEVTGTYERIRIARQSLELVEPEEETN